MRNHHNKLTCNDFVDLLEMTMDIQNDLKEEYSKQSNEVFMKIRIMKIFVKIKELQMAMIETFYSEPIYQENEFKKLHDYVLLIKHVEDLFYPNEETEDE